MWAGDLHGIASLLCFLHHFFLGYCKWYDYGVSEVFLKCANFTSREDWRSSQDAIARFIESQPCFDTGIERKRLVSLGNWSDIT